MTPEEKLNNLVGIAELAKMREEKAFHDFVRAKKTYEEARANIKAHLNIYGKPGESEDKEDTINV